VAHGLSDQLQAVETSDDSQDAGGVGALLTSRLDQPHLAETVEHLLEKESLSEPPSRSLLRNSLNTEASNPGSSGLRERAYLQSILALRA
jgi:hypothetical protein